MSGNDSFTKVLLHFDGNLNDANVGGAARTWTAHGGAAENGAAKFGSASLALASASSQYIDTPDNASLALGNSDFVIEAWVKRSTDAVVGYIAGQQNSIGADISFDLRIDSNNKLQGRVSADGSTVTIVITGNQLFAGTYHWVVFVRSGNSLALYVDGTQDGTASFSSTVHDSSASMAIGAPGDIHTQLFNGLIDEFRLSVGTDRGFTGATIPVPTAAYANDLTQTVSISCNTTASIVTPHPIRAVLAQIAAATAVTLRKSALKLIAIAFPALVTVSQDIARIVRNSLYKVRSNAPTLDRSRANSSVLQKSRASDPVLDE